MIKHEAHGRLCVGGAIDCFGAWVVLMFPLCVAGAWLRIAMIFFHAHGDGNLNKAQMGGEIGTGYDWLQHRISQYHEAGQLESNYECGERGCIAT